MWYDLNVPYDTVERKGHGGGSATALQADIDAKRRVMLCKLADLGYGTMAHCVTVASVDALAKPHASASAASCPITQVDIPGVTHPCKQPLDLVDGSRHALLQLRRVTVGITEPSKCHGLNLNNPALAPYDLVAVQPQTEAAFQFACQQLDVDLITLDLSQRLPFYLKAPTLNAAVVRGVAFEITYAPALRDLAARRHFIHQARSLLRLTHGRHVVLSSAALTALECRAPVDVANLARVLFGLPLDTARQTLDAAARSVVCRAASRRRVTKGVFRPLTVPGTDELAQPPSPESDAAAAAGKTSEDAAAADDEAADAADEAKKAKPSGKRSVSRGMLWRMGAVPASVYQARVAAKSTAASGKTAASPASDGPPSKKAKLAG